MHHTASLRSAVVPFRVGLMSLLLALILPAGSVLAAWSLFENFESGALDTGKWAMEMNAGASWAIQDINGSKQLVITIDSTPYARAILRPAQGYAGPSYNGVGVAKVTVLSGQGTSYVAVVHSGRQALTGGGETLGNMAMLSMDASGMARWVGNRSTLITTFYHNEELFGFQQQGISSQILNNVWSLGVTTVGNVMSLLYRTPGQSQFINLSQTVNYSMFSARTFAIAVNSDYSSPMTVAIDDIYVYQ